MSPRAERPYGRFTIALVAIVIVVLSIAVLHWQASAHERRGAAVGPSAGAATVVVMPPLMAPRILPPGTTVAIVRDAASDAYYDTPASLDSVVNGWQALLENMGARVVHARPADSAAVRGAGVLLFPSEPCLGQQSRTMIRTALRRGQGVVATWITGTRDGGCSSVGWSLPAMLAGAMRLDTLDTRAAVYVTIPNGGTLTADVPPGSRLELLVGNHVAARSPTRDLIYSDRMMNPEPALQSELLDGAASHAQGGTGRSVYLGFDPLRVADNAWSQILAQMIARNAIAWAANLPVASVEPWPRGKAAAAMIAQDVEDEFSNAVHAVDSLDAAGVRGTWYVVSEPAARNKKLLARLARNGEIGSHTENHDVLAGVSLKNQKRRLTLTQDQLRSLVGHPVTGLRPPEEQFDRNTLRAWVDAGGRYVFGANDARSASPELLTLGADTLVLLGRVNNDDVLSLRKIGEPDVARLTAQYIDAFEKVHALGGLFIMSYHSQYMSTPELVPVVAAVARRIRADTTTWLTTGTEAAEWWRGRFAVRLATTVSPSGQMTVTATNTARSALEGAVVRVDLPTGWVGTGADGATLLPAPAGIARLALPALPAGSAHTVTVSLAHASDAR
jgi:polysaccharide deacetylase